MTFKISDRSPAADRDRRERLGISVDDLAARAGVTAQELTTYEQAKSEEDGNPALAMKVSDALDAFENEIANESVEPPSVRSDE